MTKIKKFDDLNESFNPQKVKIEGRDFYKMTFKLKEVLPEAKLINFNIKDFDDGEETVLDYYVNDQYPTKEIKVGDDTYKIKLLSEMGWLVLRNDKPVYVVGIYEPHGESINAKRGMATFWGHEEIINLWLDDGEYTHNHTR